MIIYRYDIAACTVMTRKSCYKAPTPSSRDETKLTALTAPSSVKLKKQTIQQKSYGPSILFDDQAAGGDALSVGMSKISNTGRIIAP